MGEPRLWLERDDHDALRVRADWVMRAKAYQRTREAAFAARFKRIWDAVEASAVDYGFATLVSTVRGMILRGETNCDEMTEARRQSFDDAASRPWLRAKPMCPVRASSPDVALAYLVASLDTDPPDLSRKKP